MKKNDSILKWWFNSWNCSIFSRQRSKRLRIYIMTYCTRSRSLDLIKARALKLHETLVKCGMIESDSSPVLCYPPVEVDVYGRQDSTTRFPSHIHHVRCSSGRPLEPHHVLSVTCLHDLLVFCPICRIDLEAEQTALAQIPPNSSILESLEKARMTWCNLLRWHMLVDGPVTAEKWSGVRKATRFDYYLKVRRE